MKTILLAAICAASITPALLAQSAIRINDPLTEPEVAAAHLSPSGDWVAYTHNASTRRELVARNTLTSPGGSMQLIAYAPYGANQNIYGVTWRSYVDNGQRTEDVVYVARNGSNHFIQRANIGTGSSSSLVSLLASGSVETVTANVQDAPFDEWFVYSYRTRDYQFWPPVNTNVLAVKSAKTGQGYVLESNINGATYGGFDTVELSNGEVHALYTVGTSANDLKLYSCKVQPVHGVPTLIQVGTPQIPFRLDSAAYVGATTDVMYSFDLSYANAWLAHWDSSTNYVTLLTNTQCDSFGEVRTQPSDLSSSPAAPRWAVFSHRKTAGVLELGMCRIEGGGVVPVAKKGSWFVDGANQPLTLGDVEHVSLSASGAVAAFVAKGSGSMRDVYVTGLSRPISVAPTARIGQNVTVEVPCSATESCSLFLSPLLVSPLISLPGFAGRIEIDPTLMLPIYMNQSSGNGAVSTGYTIPNDPALICTRFYMQAIRETSPGLGDITRSSMVIINQ